MRATPVIAPELRALIEEIVDDPRSSLRLTPRRSLTSWFESPKGIRPREAGTTAAERHLVEVHREGLAQLLLDAAKIAYWKVGASSLPPVLPPVRSDGKLVDQAAFESSWRRRLGREQLDGAADGVQLLRKCLEGFDPRLGEGFAKAALGLAPRDEARLTYACFVCETRPNWGLYLLSRLAQSSPSIAVRGLALERAGASHAWAFRLGQARESYLASAQSRNLAWISLLNLACIGQDLDLALEASESLRGLETLDLSVTAKARNALLAWTDTRTPREMETARSFKRSIENRLSPLAASVASIYETP